MNAMRIVPKALMLAAVALVGLTPNASALTVFSEDWESPSSNWTYSGATVGQDCTTSYGGSCSLKVDADCCDTRVYAQHSVARNLDLPLVVTFYFKGPNLNGSTDSEVRLITNAEHVVFSITRPGNAAWPNAQDNNGMSLDNAQPNHNPCGNWLAVNTWYKATITFNPLTDNVNATVTLASNPTTVVGACDYGFSGTQLSSIRFDGVDYGSSLAYHYDDVAVTV